MTIDATALRSAPQVCGPQLVDPTLHDWQDRMGEIAFALAAGAMVNPGPAAPLEPVRLHIRHYQQNSLCASFPYDHAAPPMVDFTACVVCAATMVPAAALVDRTDARYLTLGICPQCGFMQHVRRPPERFYETFYETQWDAQRRDGRTPTADMVPANTVFADVVAPFLRPEARVLEVGSGWGGHLRGFAARGYEVYGIEPSTHRSQFVRDQLGLPCEAKSAESLPIGTAPYLPGSFDLLFSCHVLEHVFNPRQVVETLYPLLADDGLAFIVLPNTYCEQPTMLAHDITHCCSFNRDSLLLMLQMIGFDLVQDLSTHTDLALIVRRTAPLAETKCQDRLSTMRRVQPQRALAHLLERSGLACIPEGWRQDVTLRVQWSAHFPNLPGPEVQLAMESLMMGEDGATVEALRDGIRRRVPLESLAPFLPIYHVYRSSGVPLWYY